MEYEQPRAEYRRSSDRRSNRARTPQEEYIAGLRAMGLNWELMVANFAWCAGQIIGDPDAPGRIRGMMEFAIRYREESLRAAVEALEEDSGVTVQAAVILPIGATREARAHMATGILVGITDAVVDRVNYLKGVVVLENKRGQEVFANCRIRLDDGVVIIARMDQDQEDRQMREDALSLWEN